MGQLIHLSGWAISDDRRNLSILGKKHTIALHSANSCGSAVQEKEHRNGLYASVPPGVPRSVLHNHVSADADMASRTASQRGGT